MMMILKCGKEPLIQSIFSTGLNLRAYYNHKQAYHVRGLVGLDGREVVGAG